MSRDDFWLNSSSQMQFRANSCGEPIPQQVVGRCSDAVHQTYSRHQRKPLETNSMALHHLTRRLAISSLGIVAVIVCNAPVALGQYTFVMDADNSANWVDVANWL